MSSAERETIGNWQVERERVLPGSKFSKGLLLVVGWCQGTGNGPLISFKRLKGLKESLTGLLYVTRRHGGGRITSSHPDCGKKLVLLVKLKISQNPCVTNLIKRICLKEPNTGP